MMSSSLKKYPFRQWHLVLFLLIVLACGCSTLECFKAAPLLGRSKENQDFLTRLNQTVMNTGVKDASSFPVPGFPYLRTNRFLVSLSEKINDDPGKEQWVAWMRQLDLNARKKEIQNLPDESVASLGFSTNGKPDREGLIKQMELCTDEFYKSDKSQPGFYEALLSRRKIPEEYSLTRRIIGFYPVFSIPVIHATDKVHKKFKSIYHMEFEDLPKVGNLVRFGPGFGQSLNRQEIQLLLERSKKNSLGVPWLTEEEAQKVASSFAPVIIQDIVGTYDKFGEVFWKGDLLAINSEKPALYYYLTHALVKETPILQINYVIWFPKRNGKNSPWIERGNVDGLTFRVSLDPQGEPFMVDIMNNCGCYHLFIPKKESLDQVRAKKFSLDPFVPQWLPSLGPGERLGIRIVSGWHQVVRVLAVTPTPVETAYTLLSYDALEALPEKNGQRGSMFDHYGIGKGATRPKEQVIFFPMGIPSVGGMRQRGHHAILLVGRGYFDDPALFEKNFVFK